MGNKLEYTRCVESIKYSDNLIIKNPSKLPKRKRWNVITISFSTYFADNFRINPTDNTALLTNIAKKKNKQINKK